MERQELLNRIEKKNKDIAKIEKRIAKWSSGLRPEDIEICKPFGNCVYGTAPRGTSWSNYHGTKEFQVAYDNYKNYKAKEGDNIPSSDDWNKGPNIGELYSAYRDLGEARNTLANYQIALEKMDNFEKEEKIEALWEFLCEWENKAYNWYLENAKKYFELKRDYVNAKKIWEKDYLEENPMPNRDENPNDYKYWDRAKRYAKSNWEERYWNPINGLTSDITRVHGHYVGEYPNREYVYDSYDVDTEKLAKVLSEEKTKKYQDLVKRVTSVVGNIVDASNLRIGVKNGEINGVVVGDRSKARVETISASGPIQCFHYRVLVHEIRG